MGEEKAPGLKDGAGVLVKQESHLEILCLPQDLPEFIEVDISALSIGDTVHLSAIKLPTGVSLAHPVTDEEHDHAVVSIQHLREEEPEETAAAVPVETVITGQKAESEEPAESTDKNVKEAKESKEKPAK